MIWKLNLDQNWTISGPLSYEITTLDAYFNERDKLSQHFKNNVFNGVRDRSSSTWSATCQKHAPLRKSKFLKLLINNIFTRTHHTFSGDRASRVQFHTFINPRRRFDNRESQILSISVGKRKTKNPTDEKCSVSPSRTRLRIHPSLAKARIRNIRSSNLNDRNWNPEEWCPAARAELTKQR